MTRVPVDRGVQPDDVDEPVDDLVRPGRGQREPVLTAECVLVGGGDPGTTGAQLLERSSCATPTAADISSSR